MALRFPRGARTLNLAFFALIAAATSTPAFAQADYSVRFEMEKAEYLLGEPVFCRFVIQNTGTKVFAFRYRTPTRALGTDYDQEPRFQVTNLRGVRLRDPGRKPCGSPQGSAVYGSVTLPPGQTHAESWLLNQWAAIAAPGRYKVRAQRRLDLRAAGAGVGELSDKTLAFAQAIDELTVTIVKSTPEQIEGVYKPFLAVVENPRATHAAEAVVVLTSLPQPFFLDRLSAMANPGNPDRWDRRDVLDGLARLNTPASWAEILKRFREPDARVSAKIAEMRGRSHPAGSSNSAGSVTPAGQVEDPLRSYAMLLLAEKSDAAFVPTFLDILAKSSDPLRGDVLRTLGFFHDPRASQALFENLHSAQVTDRMNAILGLKTMGGKEVIPPILSALNDPEPQVQQVANFALEGLTGHKVVTAAPASATSPSLSRAWHAWWQSNAVTFNPPSPAPCHDW